MIIRADYDLVCNENMCIIYNNESILICPHCSGQLKYRDSRRRIIRKEGGQTIYITIRRLKCKHCGRLHNELPDFITPFKHYCSDIIERAVDELITPDTPETEDYPCEQTMKRWEGWILDNEITINKYLKSDTRYTLNFFGFLTDFRNPSLRELRDRGGGWLNIINLVIYNAGGTLSSIPLPKKDVHPL